MRLALAFTSLALMAAPASAATVAGVFNTGVDATGTKLADGAADAHYTVNGGTPYVYTNGLYYTAPDAKFISVDASGGVNDPNSLYSYSTTFDLTGYNFATASLSGMLGADNYATVFLNGVQIAQQPQQTIYPNFTSLTPFSATSGFIAGLNTLSFSVTDTGKPSALMVSGLTVNATAVPELATWGMMILGFGAIGGAMRRRAVTTTVRYA